MSEVSEVLVRIWCGRERRYKICPYTVNHPTILSHELLFIVCKVSYNVGFDIHCMRVKCVFTSFTLKCLQLWIWSHAINFAKVLKSTYLSYYCKTDSNVSLWENKTKTKQKKSFCSKTVFEVVFEIVNSGFETAHITKKWSGIRKLVYLVQLCTHIWNSTLIVLKNHIFKKNVFHVCHN